MKYRAEIDGLRAFAVVPVILFHAGFELFSGGFVGVDIFFVISGYLITTILIDDIENNRFSIVNFYERRARRILPALIFMIFLCIPFAWMWMLPSQAKDFSQSIVAVIFFASNILFWIESGYFEAEAEEKPLLHTWSLAVEEQYYILFPVFLFLTWRYGKNKVFWMIVVFSAISLASSEWAWRNNPTANFYLAPTRAWELFAGSIVAFIVQKYGVRSNNTASLCGFIAILIAIFVYDENTPFPSVYALVPVIGVALVVLFADKDTIVAKFLSKKLLVGIGLISYSAYLWHQPLFAFARIRSIESPSILVFFILSMATICIAYFSWKYIERPFRDKNYFPVKKIFFLSGVSGISLFLLGSIGHLTNGVKEYRFSDEQLRMLSTAAPSPRRSDCHYPQEESSLSRTACQYFSGTAKVAVFGNSHATELAFALAKELKPFGTAVVHHTMSGCNHNYDVTDEMETVCQRWHNKVLKNLIVDDNIEYVVLSYRNEGYLKDEQYSKSLVKIADSLLDSGKEVILVLQAPLLRAHIGKYFLAHADNLSEPIIGIDQNLWEGIYSESQSLLNKMSDEVVVIDPISFFCENNQCLVSKNGYALYFDDNHMSIFGARVIAEAISPLLDLKQIINFN